MIPILFTVIAAYILLAGRFYYNIPVSNITGSQWLASANNYMPSFADVLKQGLWGVFFESPNQFISSFNNVLWTIKIEFIGSILVFSFVSLLGDLKNRWVFYVTTALILLKTYYLAFIIGMILSDLYSGKNSEKFTIKNSLVKVELLAVGLFFGSYYLGGWWGASLCESLHLNILNSSELFRTIGAGLVLLVLLNSTTLKKVFSNKIFVFLGKISFTMYLLHLLVIYSISSLLFIALFTVLPYNISYIIMFLFTLPIVLDVSYLAHKYVDDPGVRLSRMIYDRYFRSVPVKQKEKEPNFITVSEPF
jgi:peptidoglycan/LPS O-acetylase OafA/YrhL